MPEFERLFDKDDALKDAKDEDGQTALILAILEGHSDIAKMLVDHGADVDAQDIFGGTALIEASFHGCLDVAKMLVDHGADLNAREMNGDTALVYACMRGHLAVAAMLVDHGADAEVRSRDGDTAIKLTTRRGYLAFADMLESKSAERTALISSSDLAPTMWASIVAVPPPSSFLSSFSLSPPTSTITASPPPPFQLCSWPRLVSFFLPPTTADALHARVVGAHTDVACNYLFCTRRVRRLTGAGALWPIRNTLRDFLVHSDAATRRLMLELEPILQERAGS